MAFIAGLGRILRFIMYTMAQGSNACLECDILGICSSGVAWVFFLVRQFARGVRKLKKNGRLKCIFPSLNGYFMISIITEITRRYASNDRVYEFISEPWEWLHEASSRVSDRIYICNRKKNENIK
jgi:hypothetical protein